MNRGHIEHSPLTYAHAAGSAPAVNQSVTDNGSKSLALAALVFGVSATVLSLVLLLFCWGLWARQDLLRMFYQDIKTELIRQGGNPHPHMPSESP